MSYVPVYFNFLKSVDRMTSTGIYGTSKMPMPICGRITASDYV